MRIPKTINYLYNWRSIIRLCLLFQILTRLLLSMHFETEFIVLINYIWQSEFRFNLWFLHINTASLFELRLFLHIFKSIKVVSFRKLHVIGSRIVIFILIQAICFIGYVLPYRQISFWAAIVIINLLSILPYSQYIIVTIWGRFVVCKTTAIRFYTLHFLLPFLVLVLLLVHLIILHTCGSNRFTMNIEKLSFFPTWGVKDLISWILLVLILLKLYLELPNVLGDVENFIPGNSFVTPTHILPEWYYLPEYRILWACSSKVVRVIIIFLSVLSPRFMVILLEFNIRSNINTSWIILGMYCIIFILLMKCGRSPVIYPYLEISQILTPAYFISCTI